MALLDIVTHILAPFKIKVSTTYAIIIGAAVAISVGSISINNTTSIAVTVMHT